MTSSRISAGRLVRVDRAGHRAERRRRDVVAALDQAHELVDHLRRLADVALGAVQREDIAAQVDVAAEPILELPQHGVLGARQLRGDRVVEGELPACQRPWWIPQLSRSRTAALTRLPSARPSTFGMTIAMTFPISLGSETPASETAASTIFASSSSQISAGR